MGCIFQAQAGSVLCSKHDLAGWDPTCTSLPSNFAQKFETVSGNPVTEVCVFCHTPHSYSSQGVLWNRTNSSLTYNVYTSPTLTKISLNNPPQGLTLMCMSCHDGITSLAANSSGAASSQTILNRPNDASGGNPNLRYNNGVLTEGTIGEVWSASNYALFGSWGPNIGNVDTTGQTIDLSNDHPVSFTWVNSVPGIIDPDGTGKWDTSGLQLFNNRMECSTCHDVHNPDILPFLVMSNNNSAMCRKCHVK